MVFFNYATMQMAAKIVYYGPGLCGKTTNLQQIYQKTSPKSRGEMVSLETETDRTLFFDLLPLDVGNIAGFKTRFQLYTVPGQVFYNSTRKLVLRGVDGIVFVADSQIPMLEANVESMKNLEENLRELGLEISEIPMVLQFNKRDLKNITPVEQMNFALNPRNLPYYEAAAVEGNGVFETLKGISKSTLITLRKKALGEEKPKAVDTAAKQPEVQKTPPPAPTPVPAKVDQARPATPPPPVTPMPAPPMNQTPGSPQMEQHAHNHAETPAPPVHAQTPPPPPPIETHPPMPTAAELAREKVEFAEVSSPVTQPPVKKIAVKSSDIALKLDALRDLYTGRQDTRGGPKKNRDVTADALSELLEVAKGKERKVSKKLKIRLEPSELDVIKNLTVDFHLTGGTLHKRFSNAMTVNVEGKSNPKRVVLEIRLEILKK